MNDTTKRVILAALSNAVDNAYRYKMACGDVPHGLIKHISDLENDCAKLGIDVPRCKYREAVHE